MKWKLLLLLLISSAVAYAQPANYSYRATRERLIAHMSDSSLHIPAGSTFSLRGGSARSGALFSDSVGADSGLYHYLLGVPRKLATESYVNSHSSTSSGLSDTSQFIGTRYAYAWSTNPLTGWTDNTPVTTITTGGTNTVFAGGSFAAGNNITQPFYIGSENWTITQPIVCGTINNTSYGLSFSISGSVAGTATLGGFFLLSDTVGRVAYTADGQLPGFNSASSRTTSNFIFTTGDTLDLKMQRRDRVVVTTMTNRSNGVSATIVQDDQYCTVGTLAIGFYGGSWTFIDSFRLTYDDVQYAQVAGAGNSIISGATADNVATDWFNIATEGVAGGVVHMGAGFEQSIQGTYRMDDILNWYKPKTLLLEYGVNDFLNTINIDSFSKRMQRIVVPAKAAGITPVIIGIVPQSTNATVYNDTLRAIASRNNIEFVDIFTALKAPSATTLNTLYGPGAGDPHPYQNGHGLIGRMVKDQVGYLWTASPILTLKSLPTVISPKYYLAQDQYGNFGKAYNSFQSDYIQNNYINNIIGDAQPASIAINGRAVFTGVGTASVSDFVVVGSSGTLSNPDFSVSAGVTHAGTLSAGSFSSGLFSVSTNPSLSAGNFIWSGGAQILGFTPFTVMMNNPTGLATNVGLAVDNNTSATAPTYKPQTWGNNGTVKSYIDRAGGFHTDTVSGYNTNVSGLYTAQSFVSKKYADSLAAGLILTSGESTPTLTSVANVASSSVSSNALYYSRVGNYVTCTLILTVTPTLTATNTQIDFSLPIASNFGLSTDLKGNGTVIGALYGSVLVTADNTNDRAHIEFTSQNTSAHTVSITFQYKII